MVMRSRRRVGILLSILGAMIGISAMDGGKPSDEESFAQARKKMVQTQIAARGVDHPVVIEAMRKVPRHLFVPPAFSRDAYADTPLPIGSGQTISQPYIVAVMSALIDPRPGMKVLEIGTGSGYQTAVLCESGVEVYSIEIVEVLAEQTALLLGELGYGRAHLKVGDGYAGWPEHAPFDAIILTAAPREIPAPLLEQVKPGGCIVAPVGDLDQELKKLVLSEDGWKETTVFPVRFVPMTGEAESAQ